MPPIDPILAWESVKTGGLLLSPTRLTDVFPASLDPLSARTIERLRRAIAALNGAGPPPELLDVVLEDILALGVPLEPDTGHWLKGGALGSEWTHRALSGEAIKPQRVWQGAHGAELPLFVDRERRLGIGRGRRMPARVVEWLRAGERSLALLTNGWQWRLIHASLDAEAFAEWDVGLWFEEGEPGPQVAAMRALLDRQRLTPPADNAPAPLLAAIAASRKGQGELSAALGERVRQAVELLIQRVFRDAELPAGLAADEATHRQIYRAATRVVMRMVVVLFAEARDDLLPRSNPVYHLSYGLQGLREALQQAGAGTRDGLARLAHRHAAWPRVLALFRLIWTGSPHKDLTLIRYGGGLFEPGDAAAADPLRRALAALEDPARGPHDADVYRLLDLLCVTEMRLRQGAAYRRVNVPVDFSDLSSEYIGILYEGLLDYELRRAAPGDPIVFLALGDQPALPLSRLEAMSDKALADLVEKLKVRAQPSDDEEADDEDDDEADAGVEDDEATEEAEDPAGEADAESDDARQVADERARAWARRAVEAGKLVRKPKSKKKDALAQHDAAVAAMARSLIVRTVLPDEWFLVRWGGTRKGAGTFYTRPGLAVPTVQRTLRPLAYDPPAGAGGRPDESAPAADWSPRRPEEILALKVCDPAMGSASFLVASLRFLTDALYQSLHHHGRIAAQGEHTLVTLAEGKPSTGSLGEETLPCRPDAEDFEPRLRAILKRYVVERCLYGVDLDPLAVELGRLALWIETLDRDLPFEFLDHKLKVGNALVGCWFDRFRDYPVLAWNREGGDKTHANGVHFPKAGWTDAIRALRDGEVKRELVELISRQLTFDDHFAGRTPEALHDEAAAALEAMHAMGVADGDRRAEIYREKLGSGSPLQDLRAAFDAWCALWFWPADRLDLAPTPRRFHDLTAEQRAVVAELWGELRFFHWELEYPDVFCREREAQTEGGAPPHAGFDAIVGNPPWEIQKPNSKEFFSNLDPLYRTYGKQEALRAQQAIFEASAADERAWLEYSARFKALSNWSRSAAWPFGDGADDGVEFGFGRGGDRLHPRWAAMCGGHRGWADPRHAFRHQGSADINTYKMFLEQAHALLRVEGQLGIVVPSGLYTDKGSTDLRRLFLEGCRWQWLFGFENKLGIFDIHRSFKFCPVIVRKGGATEAIRAAFMRHELADWAEAERHVIPYGREQIETLSPRSRAFFEVGSERDIGLLAKLFSSGVLFEDRREAWGLRFTTELHKTNDSSLLQPAKVIEAKKLLREGDDSRDCAVRRRLLDAGYAPVWEGKNCRFEAWPAAPELFIEVRSALPWLSGSFPFGVRRIARNTDQRTLIGCIVPPLTPTTYTIEICRTLPAAHAKFVYGLITSWVLDFVIRFQVASSVALANLDALPIPADADRIVRPVARAVDRLLSSRGNADSVIARRCALDALVAAAYGLTSADLGWILRDCDLPTTQLASGGARSLDPKGFWRIDKEQPPEVRQTVLTLVAYSDLLGRIASNGGDTLAGMEDFVDQNRHHGWAIPATLTLADYGLGHDERAKTPQPVGARLAERFLPWQLAQSPVDSWRECEIHARNILGESGFAKLQAEIRGDAASHIAVSDEPTAAVAEESAQYGLFDAGPSPTGRRAARRRPGSP